MDIIKSKDFKKSGNPTSLSLKIRKWLGKDLRLGKYSFPARNVLLATVVIFLVVSIAIYFFFYFHPARTDPNAALEKEIKTLTAQLGKFMELPAGEQPTLATVTDKGKLKGQEFFSNSQNGDKLLIYAKAKKAILYRPATGKIIEVTNLTSGGGAGNGLPSQ